MQEKILKNIVLNNILKENLIQNNDVIVVAVSGGPDSMCLLDILIDLKSKLEVENEVRYELVVAHVNHMIREESKAERKYVEKYCDNNSIKFFYLEKDVPKLAKENKMSEEAYGRNIRYEFFNKICKEIGANKIAVAHNLDDNVETIFLNILRGCGLKGLTGMQFSYKNIIRPLLTIEKKDVLEYNVLRNLNPCFDKTNDQDIYIRNKIRLKLIPMLKSEYNPNIVNSITRMKNILEQDNEFIDDYTQKIVERTIREFVKDKIVFDYGDVLKEHLAIRTRYIRKIIELKLNTLDGIENIYILDILKLLENNKKGKRYIIGKKFTIEIINKNIAIIY